MPGSSRQNIDCVYQLYSIFEMKASRDDVRSMVAALFVTNAALDRARRQKKGASTLSLLQVVASAPGIRPTEIAAAQDVHPSQVTRQVRELESVGLVRVTADRADRRSCRVALTSAGAEEQVRLTEEGLDRFALFVADWEREDVRTLTSLLEKLEASKAAVAAQERPPTGRRWAAAAD
jgi:DNA-binding MarR family transcriptional regulator